jgi:3-hydroxyisobutyrate dehydrogenase
VKQKIGILGLGKIGRAIGENLLKDGYQVSAVRRRSTEDFTSAGGKLFGSALELARACDVLITCLPTAESMHEAYEGREGLIAGAHGGLTVVELGTFPVELKSELAAKLKARQVPMLDCPISGTPAMVAGKNGVLFVSGDKAVAERCSEAFGAFAPKNFYVGEFGCGMAIKLVTNFLVGANSLALAEAFLLGIKSGLDPELMIKVIGPSAGGSRVFDFRAPMIAARKFRPAPGPCHILWKDLQFIQQQSSQLGLAAPVLAAQMEWFGKMVRQGRQDDEVAAIFEVLEAESRRSS